MSEKVSDKLARLFSARTVREIGQFQFINLDTVKDEARDQWPRLKNKIFDVGRFFIEKRVSQGDVIIRCQDGFLVVFSKLDPESAREKCDRITREMNAFFVGEQELAALEVRAASHSMDETQFHTLIRSEDEAEALAHRPLPVPEDTKPYPVRKRRRPNPFGDWKSGPGWNRIVFRPLWDARAEAITGAYCLPTRWDEERGLLAEGYRALHDGDDAEQAAQVDDAVLEYGLKVFAKASHAGQPFLLTLPIHFPAFEKRERRIALAKRLGQVPAELRRYLFFSMERIPAGAPTSHVYEAVHVLRPFGSGVFLGSNSPEFAWEQFGDCAARRFSLDLHALGLASPRRLEGLRHFFLTAKRARAEAQLLGVNSAVDLQEGLAMGGRFFSGDLIGLACDEPPAPRSVTASDLYNAPSGKAALFAS